MMRLPAAVAETHSAVVFFVGADRIRRRLAAGGDASDATPAIAARLAGVQDPWPDAIDLDTGDGPGEALMRALAAIAPVPVLSRGR